MIALALAGGAPPIEPGDRQDRARDVGRGSRAGCRLADSAV